MKFPKKATSASVAVPEPRLFGRSHCKRPAPNQIKQKKFWMSFSFPHWLKVIYFKSKYLKMNEFFLVRKVGCWLYVCMYDFCILFTGAGADEKKNRSRSKTDRLRNTDQRNVEECKMADLQSLRQSRQPGPHRAWRRRLCCQWPGHTCGPAP